MQGYNEAKRYKSRHEGVSLVVVLVLSMLGFILLGGAVYMISGFASSAKVSIAHNMEYNIMQEALEQAKADLRQRIRKTGVDAPRWNNKPGATPRIASPDMLLIENGTFEQVIDQNKLGGKGFEGVLTVKIFDMQYDPSLVDIPHTNREAIEQLPPSLRIPSTMDHFPPVYEAAIDGDITDAGVYLIRATLRVADTRAAGSWTTKTLETAVIQKRP